MAELDKAFAGAIPAIYDTHLGPLLFEPFAEDLARRMAGFHGKLLETAAGTGIATLALARSLGDDAEITATDLNQAMLDHAARKPGATHIKWLQADAVHLPFADATFDAVVCQFGVMFFPDKVNAFAEARRVLWPEGTFLFSVWDRLEENPLALAVHHAVSEAFPDDPPLFLARTPYGYHDTGRIAEELSKAGFTSISIETVAVHAHDDAA